jgi:protoporphyrinogen oxidase
MRDQFEECSFLPHECPFEITILGGGIAGLAAGYYAKKAGISFHIFEASERVGGNCTTFREDAFLFDSGAHRFHDKDPHITAEVEQLLGADLASVEAPSKIYYDGKWLRFPLSPFDLLQKLGVVKFAKASQEALLARLMHWQSRDTFEGYALRKYGRVVAEAFLLNYSEKLWGLSADKLAPAIAGERLKGLNLKNFLLEIFSKERAEENHLEGTFYYPRKGIGAIADAVAQCCGEQNITTRATVTRILHDYQRILAVEINREKAVSTNELISTLPLGPFVHMFDPPLPDEILFAAKHLKYRELVLVALCLERDFVTDAATVYFPELGFPFTRIYEPKVRSSFMSPAGQTSLVAEIPCQNDDRTWVSPDERLVSLVKSHIVRTGLIKASDVISNTVVRLRHAYPVLDHGFEKKLKVVNFFLDRFKNLRLAGRNGLFQYSWIHNMFRRGKELIDRKTESVEQQPVA